jgi:hypothetical protein
MNVWYVLCRDKYDYQVRSGPFADRHEAERLAVEVAKRSDCRPPIVIEARRIEPETQEDTEPIED